MQTARKDDGPNVRAEAVKALAADGGDPVKAVDRLEKRVRSNRALRDALTDPLIRDACYNAIRIVMRGERRAIWHSGSLTPEQNGNRVVALAAGISASLFDFILPGGKRLRDATGEEIAGAADFYDKQARDMAHKARWLQLVGQSVPGGKKAGDVLTEERLGELRAEAAL